MLQKNKGGFFVRNKFICHLTALLCALALLPALAPPALAADAFRDVPPTQWAYQAIMDAAGRGIAAGYQDGTFHPEGQVTYAQFSAFLARAFYNSPVNSAGSPWYKAYVDTLRADGILAGTAAEEGDAGMDKPINRYDMSQMIGHIMTASEEVPDDSKMSNAQNALSDWGSVPERYREAVSLCYAAGVLSGMPDGSFSGGQPMNRAQACTVIARVREYLTGGAVTPSPTPPVPTAGDLRTEVLQMINAERTQAGLKALEPLDSLTKAAQMRSADLSEGHFEDRPDGTSWSSVFTAAGVTSSLNIDNVDESIVGGATTAAQVLEQLKNTPGALSALMNKDYTYAGVGYTHVSSGYGGYQDFWSILYIQPAGAAPVSPGQTVPGLTAPSVPGGSGAAFEPVPIDKLANRKSLQKKATDDQLALAYAEAVKLVTPYAGLSLEQKLQGVANAVRQRFDSGMQYSMESSHYNDPYGYFIEGSASCAGCTRATGLCLNILGIPYEHVNENQYSHQWCRVNVNGTYWICDPYGLYCGPEPAPYQHPYL